MTKKERLRELVNEIYEALDEMEDILREVAPEEFGAEGAYWMAHIDEALVNLQIFWKTHYVR